MADNVAITAGSGTDIAADDVGGIKHQRVKISLGADGAATDALGGAGAVASGVQRVTLASDDPAVIAIGAKADSAWASGDGSEIAILKTIANAALDTTTPSPVLVKSWEYETVAASQTDQALGATGATADYLSHILIVPATTSPGAVSIKDGAGSAITIFTGGASSVTNLVPFVIALGMKSTGGAWKVTTGTNVSAIGVGDFT